MDIRQLLLAAFEAEHREHLDAIRAGLTASAEGRPADWNDVFRRAHSLKGAARAVDLAPVEAVAHRLETLFERVCGGTHMLDRETLSAVHLALDRVESFVADTLADTRIGSATMPDDALAALERCLAGDAATEPGGPQQGPDGAPLTRAVPASTPRPLSPPSPAPASSAPSSPTPPSQPALPTAAEPADPGQAVLRVPAVAVEALTRATHGLANALSGRAAVAEGIAALTETVLSLRRQTEALRVANRRRQAVAAERAAVSDTGPVEEIAALETALSALARDALDLGRRQRSNTAAIETAAARVREEAERLALVPAETAFGGFARALRDMARADGRTVDIVVRGLDLPVDRSTLQALRDPVLHALRNTLGHGAEPPETRAAAGKPEALSVLFEVEARGSRLVIGIHDDGRGPDLPAIEARARERGLIGPGESASADRLLAQVFEPGFSTAAGLDTLSGRGIGLSVVAEAARRLQGHVRLEPRVPHGASLVMNLPLSAARRPLLLVEAGGRTYALPSASAERLLRVDRAGLETVAGRSVARVQTRANALRSDHREAVTVPVAELAVLLGEPRTEPEASFPAVLLRAGGRRCLLAVERLHDVRTLLVLPAPPIGTGDGLVVGTVILGSETPVLVLDPESLVAGAGKGDVGAVPRSPRSGTEGYGTGRGTLPQARRSTILVVDDSITTRTLEKSILEAAGYRVVVCVDGQDALDRLRAGIEPVDLVVADVEMPRLDGFGLVKALRAQSAFATLPVILMTSRGAAEDVARGLELGADAYLTKQKFDQRELLDTVGQLL